MTLQLLSIFGLLAFSGIHLAPLIHSEAKLLPSNKWLSFASGISVGYVFLEVLPLIAEAQITGINSNLNLTFLQNNPFLIALVGFLIFYILEGVTFENQILHRTQKIPNLTFYIHLLPFALVNIFFGYTLISLSSRGATSLLAFIIGIGLHLLTTDVALKEDHKHTYDSYGRWILILALAFGWAVAYFLNINPDYVYILSSFISGAVLLNVIKEELSDKREDKYLYLLLGASLSAGLLLLV